MNCPYCGNPAVWCENKEIYGKNYGKSFMCWLCKPCDAYVGCHENSEKALGTLANKELRNLRIKCHDLFDTLWKTGYMTRHEAYKYLGEIMNLGYNDRHIGKFTKEQCLEFINKFK